MSASDSTRSAPKRGVPATSERRRPRHLEPVDAHELRRDRAQRQRRRHHAAARRAAPRTAPRASPSSRRRARCARAPSPAAAVLSHGRSSERSTTTSATVTSAAAANTAPSRRAAAQRRRRDATPTCSGRMRIGPGDQVALPVGHWSFAVQAQPVGLTHLTPAPVASGMLLPPGTPLPTAPDCRPRPWAVQTPRAVEVGTERRIVVAVGRRGAALGAHRLARRALARQIPDSTPPTWCN